MKPLATNYYQLTIRYVWGRDLSGTLDGAGGLSRYGAISRRATEARKAKTFFQHKDHREHEV